MRPRCPPGRSVGHVLAFAPPGVEVVGAKVSPSKPGGVSYGPTGRGCWSFFGPLCRSAWDGAGLSAQILSP